MGEAWPGAGFGVAGAGVGGAQGVYGTYGAYGYGQGNGYGQPNGYGQGVVYDRGYGVGFEGGATAAGKAASGDVAAGYGPGVAQAPRVPPVAVATTKWNPHVFRQGKT